MAAETSERKLTARAAQAVETRGRLLAAAIDLFSSRSYDEVAASDIAKAAGVAHGLLFHYFGNKRGIYLEAIRQAVGQLDEAFSFDPNLPPAQQLRRALTSNLRYLSRRRGMALRLVLGGRGVDPEAWAMFEAGRWRAIGATWEMLGLDPDNHALRLTGRAAVAAIDEATVYWLDDKNRFSVAVMVDYMVDLLAEALRAAATLDPNLEASDAVESLLRTTESVTPRQA